MPEQGKPPVSWAPLSMVGAPMFAGQHREALGTRVGHVQVRVLTLGALYLTVGLLRTDHDNVEGMPTLRVQGMDVCTLRLLG